MNRDITEVTAYIMYYDLLEFSVNGSFFSKIDIAIELAKEFVTKYPLDDEWEDKDWEETIENFLKLKGISI
jgi:3-methyladenine DNA glycosylase/8-oxoguanine DNA glycosylase